jgi:hypothetical protein
MNDEQPELATAQELGESDALSQKLEAIGWGLFFVWMGIAFLLDVGWGWGMVGIATIILGEALIRRSQNLNVGGFWIIVGLMFLAGGVWELYQVPWPLAPILILGCGLAVLWGAVSGKHVMKK